MFILAAARIHPVKLNMELLNYMYHYQGSNIEKQTKLKII